MAMPSSHQHPATLTRRTYIHTYACTSGLSTYVASTAHGGSASIHHPSPWFASPRLAFASLPGSFDSPRRSMGSGGPFSIRTYVPTWHLLPSFPPSLSLSFRCLLPFSFSLFLYMPSCPMSLLGKGKTGGEGSELCPSRSSVRPSVRLNGRPTDRFVRMYACVRLPTSLSPYLHMHV